MTETPTPKPSNRPTGDEFDINDPVDMIALRQPTRLGRHREIRRFDKTQLHAGSNGRAVERDYAAHYFRWGWVTRQLVPGQSILDVGCGQETPLVFIMTKKNGDQPSRYVGVDLNRINNKPGMKWCSVVDEFNFVDDYKNLGIICAKQGLVFPDSIQGEAAFDQAVNFEVIEHMTPPDGAKLLEGLRYWVKPNGYLYLSTPVFNGKAAVNHIHEYTIPELKALVESTGWEVEKRWGTFASLPAIRKVASATELALLDRIGGYYGDEVRSTFLAPLYPDASRNNMWVLRRKP